MGSDVLFFNITDVQRSLEQLFQPGILGTTWEWVKSWFRPSAAGTAGSRFQCASFDGKRKIGGGTLRDLEVGARMSMLAYAQPFSLRWAAKYLHMQNSVFSRLMAQPVAETVYLSGVHTSRMLSDPEYHVVLPDSTPIAGFFVQTPPRLWSSARRRLTKVPKNKCDLLKRFVTGHVSAYVLRSRVDREPVVYVLFRGTTSPFHGVHQYGEDYGNTQVFRVPDFSLDGEHCAGGSKHRALFFHAYVAMAHDCFDAVLRCVLELWNEGERLVVCGHSMGGALTQMFARLLYQRRRADLWRAAEFRSFATPYYCNRAAARELEQYAVEDAQPRKIMECVNDADIVNFQYQFGRSSGFQRAVQGGVDDLRTWLVQHYGSHILRRQTQTIFNLVQSHPEVLLGHAMRGAARQQLHEEKSDRAGWKPGHGASEATKPVCCVVTCSQYLSERDTNVLWKGHTNYLDANMNLTWSTTKLLEDKYYDSLRNPEGGLSDSRLIVVPMFSRREGEEGRRRALRICEQTTEWTPNGSFIDGVIRSNTRKKKK
jgi:hypothetical protein